MIPMSLHEVAGAVRGRLADVAEPSALVSGPVVVDSRLAAPGSLYVALPGERVDGHDFAAAAVAAGAVAVLATRPVAAPAVLVDDAVAALGLLARASIDRLPDLLVVAVTGSSGKTSTKDLLAQVLGRAGSTVAPPGSFNNEIGLPLTALSADQGSRHLIVEMGARGPGHLRYLSGIVPPRIGVVLNVGSAHVGVFGDREAIARAKGELPEALPAGGLAVLNADDPRVAAMAGRTQARVVTYGESERADVRAEDVSLDGQGRPAFRLCAPEGTALVRLALHGHHQVSNALATACVAREIGMGLDEVAGALEQARALSRWRMEVVQRGDGVTVVNDAYNANPESVRAALKALVEIGRGRRTWAVLGEMRELGDSSAEEHDAVGRLAVRLDVSRLVVVGEAARAMHTGAHQEGSWGEESVCVDDVEAAVTLLRREIAPGDVVLIKASRAVGLERVAEALLAPDVVRSSG